MKIDCGMEDDRDLTEPQARQDDPWLTEEDHRIIRMAKERFEEAFYIVFGGENDATS